MAKYDTGCPECGGEQLCPCSNCVPYHPDEVMWKWDSTGELISCGHCGFTMHADGWLELDMVRFDKEQAKSKAGPAPSVRESQGNAPLNEPNAPND